MKKFKVDYMVNHDIDIMHVEANSEEEAIIKANETLKKMNVSFVVYGAR